nr:hypothetical protein [Tanacetum cinerariifolium]
SNSRNKNVDTTPRYKNDNQSRQFGNQMTVNVAGARENVDSLVVQQSGIQCFNYKKFRHFAKECRKPKRVKDSTYMAKIQEVPTADSCTDSEPLEQVQNDAAYNVFANDLQHYEQSESISNTCLVETDDTRGEPNLAKRDLRNLQLEQVQNDNGYNVFANDLQHSEQSESISNTCLVETDDSNVIPDSHDMCDVDIQNDQNDVESDDKRVALANLKLNIDENKKIQKQLKKANITLAQELK